MEKLIFCNLDLLKNKPDENQNTRHRKPGNDRDHLPIVPEKFSKETIKR